MSDLLLVLGPSCFYDRLLKEIGLERKNKVNFFQAFDNLLSNYLIFKTICFIKWLF